MALSLGLIFQSYTNVFYEGKEAYNNGDWKNAIKNFENVLKLFYESFENCRILCDKPFDQGWFPDFVSSIASKNFSF